MARYRVILRAAVALALLLPATRHANAQDTLIVDSGGARWRSGENRKPAVTVDPGVIDSLPAAARRQYRKPRRYLTLNIPQPDAPPAVAERLKAPAAPEPEAAAERPEPAAAPAAEPQPERAAKHPEPPVAPAAEPEPERAAKHHEPAAPPAADPEALAAAGRAEPPAAPAPEEPAAADAPARAGIPEPPARPAAALSKPPGKPPATPALRAFLSRAEGTRPQTAAPVSAKPARAKLPPPPRPIQPRPAEPGAAAPSAAEPDTPDRFRLPPPAPATDAPRSAAASPAPAAGLPPPPPATGTSEAGVLPPPAAPAAGGPETLRRALALDAPGLAAVAAPARTGTHSETFFYEAGGAALGAEDRARLGSLAARLAAGSGLTVEIRAWSGSAEGDGVEARRRALSRAMEIRRLLIAAGVPEARIVARAAGAGEEARAHVDVVLVGRS